jgi:hypothetical protein
MSKELSYLIDSKYNFNLIESIMKNMGYFKW